jgi:hypothetical protein
VLPLHGHALRATPIAHLLGVTRVRCDVISAAPTAAQNARLEVENVQNTAPPA